MNDYLKNENGQIFTVPAGTFVRYNKNDEQTRVPGITVFIKGNTVYKDRDTITPYVSDIKLIERNGNFVFVQLDKDYYTFFVQIDSERREYFTTAHFFTAGVNDDETRAYSDFISQVHAYKENLKAQDLRAKEQKEAEKLQAEHDQRLVEVKTMKLETQKKIQVLAAGKLASKIAENKEIRALMNDYLFLEMLLKIRAL
jgi:hypothetical protein